MRTIVFPVLLTLLLTALPAAAQDQATIESGTDEQRAERRERIQELRQLLREDREQRRQEIQAQLDTLTDEQKAALQERRQMQRQARIASMVRRWGGSNNRCECAESEAEATEIQP